MTKRELTKWLEQKQHQALSTAEKEYTASLDQVKKDLCSDLGFEKIAEEMQELFEKAQTAWDGFKAKCEAVEAVSFRCSYSSPNSRLYEYVGEKGATYQRLLHNEIRVETDSMRQAKTAYAELTANIKRNYYNVIATVQSLKTAKEAAEYLTALGFDLSDLEPKPAPVTALAVQIDTSYLFLRKAA